MKIGDRIRQERQVQGKSRRELAELSGVKYPTLAGIENGDQDSSTQLHDIAAALGVSPKWLETGKGQKQPQRIQEEPSQYLGFDLETILDAQKLLREYAQVRDESPAIAEDPRRIRIAYKIVVEDSRQQHRGSVVDLLKQLSAALREESGDGNKRREAEGTGKATGSDRAGRKRTA